MKKFKIILISVIVLSIASCSSDDVNADSQFQGKWSGVYTGGQDIGSWEFAVNANGELSGTSTSMISNEIFNSEGNVKQDGSLMGRSGASSITGQFDGNTVSGMWSNDIDSGTWSGSKQ